MRTRLLLIVFATASLGAMSAEPVDSMSDVKNRVLLECKTAGSDNFEPCVTKAGQGLLALSELRSYQDAYVEPLCLQKSSGKMLAYLACFDSQLAIKKNSPLAQYSTLILRTDQFRASWVSLCKNKHGLDVSSCVKSKTADFYQVWNAYMNLSKAPGKIPRFEQCMSSQNDADWEMFVACYHR